MTNEEVKNWVQSEYKRAEKIENKQEADAIRNRVKTIFDKRFPNPDYCPSCGKKNI